MPRYLRVKETSWWVRFSQLAYLFFQISSTKIMSLMIFKKILYNFSKIRHCLKTPTTSQRKILDTKRNLSGSYLVFAKIFNWGVIWTRKLLKHVEKTNTIHFKQKLLLFGPLQLFCVVDQQLIDIFDSYK